MSKWENLGNIFSGRKGRSSFIRLHQSYDPTKKAKFRWVSSSVLSSWRSLTWGKSRWKGFHLSGQEKECSFTALLQLKRRKMTQIMAWQKRSYLIRQHSGWKWKIKNSNVNCQEAKYFMVGIGLLNISWILKCSTWQIHEWRFADYHCISRTAYLIPTMDFATSILPMEIPAKRWDKSAPSITMFYVQCSQYVWRSESGLFGMPIKSPSSFFVRLQNNYSYMNTYSLSSLLHQSIHRTLHHKAGVGMSDKKHKKKQLL